MTRDNLTSPRSNAGKLADAFDNAAAFLGRINAPIARIGCVTAGGFLIIMTATVMVQVISRYIFNSSLGWSEELSKTMMVWMAFLVAPWSWRESATVTIELFTEAMPERLRTGLQLALTLLVLLILTIFLIESFGFVARGMQAHSATLKIPNGYFYLIVPVGLLSLLMVGVELAFRNVGAVLGLSPDTTPSGSGV